MEGIREPRLRELIERQLHLNGSLAEDKTLSLRRPPIQEDQNGPNGAGAISALIFPKWFLAEEAERSIDTKAGDPPRRRLVAWRDLDETGGKRKHNRAEVTPIRFVGACRRGHLQDLDWRHLLHGDNPCRLPMWLEDRGTSADPNEIRILCDCGLSIAMAELFAPFRLGRCQGRKPWLGEGAPSDQCGEFLRFLTRGATNAYFPQVAKVISVPTGDDRLTALVRQHLGRLGRADSADEIRTLFKFEPTLEQDFQGYGVDEIYERIARLRLESGSEGPAEIPAPKQVEFDALASGKAKIGEDRVGSPLYAETL